MRRVRLDLVILAVLALAANFTFLYCSNGNYFFPDSETYLVPARNMLRGLGFVTEAGGPESFRTPGYPLFLVPFLAASNSAVPILFVQHLLNSALVIGVYLLALRISGSRLAALAAGILFAFDVPSIHYANKVLSETLFTCALFLLFALVLRIAHRGFTWRAMLIAGSVAGALVLIRPVAILYAPVVAAFLLLRGGRREVAVFLAVAFAIPILWAVRNRHETGVFTISPVAGTNMLLYRAAAVLAIDGDREFRQDLEEAQAQLTEAADREIVRKENARNILEVDSARVGEYYNRVGTRIALEHPVELAFVIVRGTLVNLFDSDWEEIMVVSTIPLTVLQHSLPAIPPIVIALAAVGIVGLWRRDRAIALLIAATIAYFLLMSAGGEAESRFRVPVMPQIALVAGIGFEAVRRGLRDTSG